MRLISASGLIGFLALCLAPSARSLEVDVGGYVDAQFNYSQYANRNGLLVTAGGVSGGETKVKTFRLNKASLDMASKVADHNVVLELELTGPSKVDSVPYTIGTVSSAITVGASRSQAYVSTSYDNGFDWTLGQFDSRYGYEGNDSTSIRYSDTGVLFDSMPSNHVGLMVGYGISDSLRFEVLGANTYDQGHLKKGNFDFGAKFRADMGSGWFNIGFLGSTGNHDQLGGVVNAFGYLGDVDFGFNFAEHTLAFYGFLKHADIDKVKSDYGIGVDLGHDPDVGLGYGIRFEYAKDGTDTYSVNTPASVIAASTVNDDVTWELTVGPQWHFHKNLVAKFDYVYKRTSYDGTTGVKFNDEENHEANLAVVYNF